VGEGGGHPCRLSSQLGGKIGGKKSLGDRQFRGDEPGPLKGRLNEHGG